MRLPPFNPRVAVAIGVGAISVTAVLAKLAGDAPASIIANYRMLFAALALLPFVIFQYRKEIRQLRPSNWILLALSGLIAAAHFTFWFQSLHHTSVASSSALIAMHPILGLIAGLLFFKERFSPGAAISIAIAALGAGIILYGDYSGNAERFRGDLLALGSMAFLAAYYMIGQRIRKTLSLLSYSLMVYAFGGLALLLYNLISSHSLVSYSPGQWSIFLAIAIIPTFLGYNLFNWALKWLKAPPVSIGMMLEPAGAAILAYLILGERITGSEWLGGAIILFGLFLFIVSTARKPKVTISQKK